MSWGSQAKTLRQSQNRSFKSSLQNKQMKQRKIKIGRRTCWGNPQKQSYIQIHQRVPFSRIKTVMNKFLNWGISLEN